MNFREGMRRLALVAGALGAVAGCFVSYLQVSELTAKRERHKEFQMLLSAPAVQKELKLLKTGLQDAKDPTPAFKYAHHGQNWFDAVAAISGSTDGWTVGEDGVSKIFFGSGSEVNCIATTEGLRHYPTDLPSAGSYLLALGWPVLGFIVPWGALTMLAWIIAGFAHKAV
jgi:hypothetical protein